MYKTFLDKSKDETETRGNHLNDIVDILIQGSQNFDHITKEDLLLHFSNSFKYFLLVCAQHSVFFLTTYLLFRDKIS